MMTGIVAISDDIGIFTIAIVIFLLQTSTRMMQRFIRHLFFGEDCDLGLVSFILVCDTHFDNGQQYCKVSRVIKAFRSYGLNTILHRWSDI